jgi:hypothetical protein
MSNSSILGKKVDEAIDRALGLQGKYKHKNSCLLLSRQPPDRLDGIALIKEILKQVKSNWHKGESTGTKNWRWEKQTRIDKNNKSQEVCLERLIVNTTSDDWVNQVPIASGLTRNGDRRRAIDLAHRCGDGSYELIELKVDQKAGSPLFAAMEILQYGLLYIFYREHLKTLEPKQLEAEKEKLLGAAAIHLKVLAPASYYKSKNGEDYRLGPLKRMINDGLKTFLAGRKFGFKMDFEFQKFYRDFTMESVVTDRRPPGQRIVEALNRRESVNSKDA